MKIERSEIYQIGGVGLLVGAFFSAAGAVGGIFSFICLVFSTGFSFLGKNFEDRMQAALVTSHMGPIVNDIAMCLILAFGARWLMSGPALIDRWMDRGVKKSD